MFPGLIQAEVAEAYLSDLKTVFEPGVAIFSSGKAA